MKNEIAKFLKRKHENKKPKEFSKKLLGEIRIMFVSQLIAALLFSWYGMDTSIFIYTVPATAGIYGAAVCFYYNKAKIENVCKGIVRLITVKTELKKYLPEEVYERFEGELGNLESTLYSKVENTLSDAVHEDITTQNY